MFLPLIPNRSFARITMLRPSGVSSARDDSWAASASSFPSLPSTGMNASACLFPKVMVPVLSRSSVSTSPAASIARPLMASTLAWFRRLMPAMPMAESRAPMVVGARQINRATRFVTDVGSAMPASLDENRE